MKISDISVERPVSVVMITLLVVLIGGVSLTRLPVDLFPELDLPYAVVMTTYQGAGPKQVEKTVSKPVEEAIATVDNVKNIISISNPDQSLVVIEFDWGTELNFATLDIRENISLLEEMLPEDVGSPRVLKFDPTQMPIMRIGISGIDDLQRLKDITEDNIKPALEKIKGVASVSISGGLEREIKINADQQKLAAYNLSLGQIKNAVSSSNLNLSGGTLNYGDKDLLLKTVGEFGSVDQIRNLEIVNNQGTKVALKNVAEVKDTTEEIDQFAYLNGKKSVGISIQKQSGANTVQVANEVEKELDKLKETTASNVSLKVVQNEAEFINEAIKNVQRNALVGALLAIIILFLFLRDIRSTFIIGTAIPISIVFAFGLMYFADLTLNLMTLGGIALGIGMLVDNAIVVLENIYRHKQESESRIVAAKRGTSEVGTAIIASTLTTGAVFLPIVYVKGLASQIFGSLALTVTFSLLASLGVALTVIPMLSSKLLSVKKEFANPDDELEFGFITENYQKILGKALDHKYIVVVLIIVGITVFGAGLSTGVIPLKTEFIPKTDQGAFSVSINLPQGEVLEETDSVVKKIEEEINQLPEVDLVYSSVGGSTNMMGVSESNVGQISVELVSLDQRERSTSEVVEELRTKIQDIAGAEIKVSAQDSAFGGGGGGRSPIEVTIKGSDIEVLTSTARDIEKKVKAVKGTRNVDISVSKTRPEVQVKLKDKIAKELGFSVAQVASNIKTAVNGERITSYKEGGDEFDVRLQLEEEQIDSLNNLNQLKITSPTGKRVPLSKIATVKLASGLNSVERQGQQRIVRVESNYYQRSLSEVQNDIKAKVDQMDLPDGYTVSYGGQVEDMQESFGDLGFALVMAIILVYMVMASQFESLIYPFTIMFTVPLALIGAVLGLAIVDAPLSVPGIIGMIMLAGIVVNNAIVMVDYINTRREKEDRREAILNAGPIRLRPIMMTTLTTVLGLLPLAIGIGEGAEVQQPMAVVVVGGLLFATVLTLIILPSIYTVFDDLSEFVKGMARGLVHGESEESEAVNQ